jgi:hypothetical protein
MISFKRYGTRFKVRVGVVTIGWIQDFYFFGSEPPQWVFRQADDSYIVTSKHLLIIAGFLSAINEQQPLKKLVKQ